MGEYSGRVHSVEYCTKRGFHNGDARGHFSTSASKFHRKPYGGIVDVSPENDRASPNVKVPPLGQLISQRILGLKNIL